jgi:hypothetical protein
MQTARPARAVPRPAPAPVAKMRTGARLSARFGGPRRGWGRRIRGGAAAAMWVREPAGRPALARAGAKGAAHGTWRAARSSRAWPCLRVDLDPGRVPVTLCWARGRGLAVGPWPAAPPVLCWPRRGDGGAAALAPARAPLLSGRGSSGCAAAELNWAPCRAPAPSSTLCLWLARPVAGAPRARRWGPRAPAESLKRLDAALMTPGAQGAPKAGRERGGSGWGNPFGSRLSSAAGAAATPGVQTAPEVPTAF